MTTALLIIDVQRALFDPQPQPFESDTVVERINLLADRARAQSVPVIFIQHENNGALAHGSEGWQLERRLKRAAADHFIRKTTPDSFLRTELQALLEALNIRHLVVSGYASEFCVDSTTRRAAGLGYAVTVAADAHTTHDQPHASAATIRAHENATLPMMRSFGPRIEARASSEIAFGG